MRVLSMTHGPSVPGGVFEHEAENRGHVLERWSVPDGSAPGRAAGYDAVMVFGGAQHPVEDERFAWLGHEEEFLREVLAERVPVFGVCLGAQMLARAAGAAVRPASAPEIGWHEVELTPAGRADPVLGAIPAHATVFLWHSYAFEIPSSGTELARTDVCSQAFHLDRPAWGIQFHAEITLSMLAAWAKEEADELPVPPAQLLAESRERIERSNELGRALAAAFLREAAR